MATLECKLQVHENRLSNFLMNLFICAGIVVKTPQKAGDFLHSAMTFGNFNSRMNERISIVLQFSVNRLLLTTY